MVERVRHCFLFNDVPLDVVRALLAREDVQTAAFSKGEVIYDPRHYRRCMGLILRGTVEVYNSADDQRVLLNVLTAGQTFGVAALFTDAPHYVSHVRSKGISEVLFIPEAALEALFAANVQAVKNYIAFLSGRIFFLNRKIEALTREGAEQRLAMYLADAAVKTDEGMVATLPFGMSKLAAHLNIGRASLYRAQQSLVDKGLIRRQGRMIYIEDIEQLSTM